MRRPFILLLVPVLFAIGCESKAKLAWESEMANLRQHRDSLTAWIEDYETSSWNALGVLEKAAAEASTAGNPELDAGVIRMAGRMEAEHSQAPEMGRVKQIAAQARSRLRRAVNQARQAEAKALSGMEKVRALDGNNMYSFQQSNREHIKVVLIPVRQGWTWEIAFHIVSEGLLSQDIERFRLQWWDQNIGDGYHMWPGKYQCSEMYGTNDISSENWYNHMCAFRMDSQMSAAQLRSIMDAYTIRLAVDRTVFGDWTEYGHYEIPNRQKQLVKEALNRLETIQQAQATLRYAELVQ
jgi:hypothetical protein